jgi:hypothetical protein
MRDDFTFKIQNALARRAGFRCSNPGCGRATSGPRTDPERAINMGIAAHITGASPHGARYDESLSGAERRAADNGLWLCAYCGSLVDKDETRYSVRQLREWKRLGEAAAARSIGTAGQYRAISPTEMRQELSVGELCALRELGEVFGCDVIPDVSVRAGDGWLNLDGAVVRGEELVGIILWETDDDHGVPYFQIDYVIELGCTLTFERFRGFVLYVAVVANGDPDADAEVAGRLEFMAASTKVEMHHFVWRLNTLRARHSL